MSRQRLHYPSCHRSRFLPACEILVLETLYLRGYVCLFCVCVCCLAPCLSVNPSLCLSVCMCVCPCLCLVNMSARLHICCLLVRRYVCAIPVMAICPSLQPSISWNHYLTLSDYLHSFLGVSIAVSVYLTVAVRLCVPLWCLRTQLSLFAPIYIRLSLSLYLYVSLNIYARRCEHT